MIRYFFSLFFFLVVSVEVFASSAREDISVDNRVLVNIRGHVITVVDVMKKLDLIFYKQYPEYRLSSKARFEFYSANWKRMLDDLIDREIVLAYSEDKQIPVNNADIREELEEMFGPAVMMNLYEAGLSLHDVQEMVRADMLLKRLISYYVRHPVMTAITPEMMKAHYQEHIKSLEKKEDWVWRSLTLKKKGAHCEEEHAKKVFELLDSDEIALDDLPSKLPEDFEVVVSQPYTSQKHELAPRIKEVLEPLEIGAWSEPVSMQGKSEPFQIYRFYVIDEKRARNVPLFSELEATLREEIARPEIMKKTLEFFTDLRTKYDVKYLLSMEQLETFEPFHLKNTIPLAEASGNHEKQS